MKKTLLTFIFIFSCLSYIKAQTIDSLYENKDEDLLLSRIESLDSMSSKQIISAVKNWSGTSFANSQEVLVSETDNQLVFNYISDAMYSKMLGMTTPMSWYVRLVVQVKDGKIRLLYYDDGNTFRPSFSNSVGSIPSMPARSQKLKMCFKENGEVPKPYRNGLINFKNQIRSNAQDLILSLANTVKNNEW